MSSPARTPLTASNKLLCSDRRASPVRLPCPRDHEANLPNPHGSTADTVSSERKRRIPSLHTMPLINEVLERDCPRESSQDFFRPMDGCVAAKNDEIPFELNVAS